MTGSDENAIAETAELPEAVSGFDSGGAFELWKREFIRSRIANRVLLVYIDSQTRRPAFYLIEPNEEEKSHLWRAAGRSLELELDGSEAYEALDEIRFRIFPNGELDWIRLHPEAGKWAECQIKDRSSQGFKVPDGCQVLWCGS